MHCIRLTSKPGVQLREMNAEEQFLNNARDPIIQFLGSNFYKLQSNIYIYIYRPKLQIQRGHWRQMNKIIP